MLPLQLFARNVTRFSAEAHLARYPAARVLVWFSCGAASAVAARLAVDRYGDRCEVLYCDTFAYEHPDNRRFFDDVSCWLGREIKILRSEKYTDIYDVFEKTGYLVGPKGARCTTELKKNVRKAYQRFDDVHVMGFTAEEGERAVDFRQENFDLHLSFELLDAGLTRTDCYAMVNAAGITLPAMYRLSYRNNNCLGCVKGGLGYWNKIRRDFPENFARMAAMERKLDVAINKTETRDPETGKRVRHRIFLDELDPSLGRYETEDEIECGVMCSTTAPPRD